MSLHAGAHHLHVRRRAHRPRNVRALDQRTPLPLLHAERGLLLSLARLADAGVNVETLLTQSEADGLERMRDGAAVRPAHLSKYAHLADIDPTTDVALQNLVRPVRAHDQDLDDGLAINAEHIAERTRVLVEAATMTSWAGHADPYLPGREQLLAAITVYRDRYDVEPPPRSGPDRRTATPCDLRPGSTSLAR